MANPVCDVLLTPNPLKPATPGPDPVCGAVVDFYGAVRALEDGAEIEGILYEAHATMAAHQLQKIAEAAAGQFGLEQVVLHHRIGFVANGEVSLFLRVRSAHRQAAFAGSQWIIEELKRRVPIWKKPRFKAYPQAPLPSVRTEVRPSPETSLAQK